MDPKLLTEGGWKAMAAKFKIKDNGLQKALASCENADEEDYDGQLKAIATVSQLATQLKKAKDVGAAAPVGKYLADVISAAESQKGDLTKAKAAAVKTGAAAEKNAEATKQKDDGKGAEESGDYSAALLGALQRLKGAKDTAYEFIVCNAKPVALMVAKKITAEHKGALTKLTGSNKFLPVGSCSFQDGKFNFSPAQPVPGLARKLQECIKTYTGKKLPIVAGTESADEDETPAAGAEAAAASATAAAGARAGAPTVRSKSAPQLDKEGKTCPPM